MTGHLHDQYLCDISACNCEMPGRECKRWVEGREVLIQQSGFGYKQRGGLIILWQITFKHI